MDTTLRSLPARRALIGMGLALLALVTVWLPFLAIPAGSLAVVFAATARQEARRLDGVVPRLATATLMLGATAIAASLALAMVALSAG